MVFSSGGSDTVVTDGGLAPGHAYTYQVRRLGGGTGRPLEESEVGSVRTLDTTSHNVVWDAPVFLGEGGGNILYDVAIINDTLAYAVDAVYLCLRSLGVTAL
jgi:hypothetical protein